MVGSWPLHDWMDGDQEVWIRRRQISCAIGCFLDAEISHSIVVPVLLHPVGCGKGKILFMEGFCVVEAAVLDAGPLRRPGGLVFWPINSARQMANCKAWTKGQGSCRPQESAGGITGQSGEEKMWVIGSCRDMVEKGETMLEMLEEEKRSNNRTFGKEAYVRSEHPRSLGRSSASRARLCNPFCRADALKMASRL